MLRIDCLWCGLCVEIEFCCGGQSYVVCLFEMVDDEIWGCYLSEWINLKGIYYECWLYVVGCCCWFNFVCDMVIYVICVVYCMDEFRFVFD